MFTRRRLVANAGVFLTVALSGCTELSVFDSGPERVVKTYYSAIDDADSDAVNNVLHPDASAYPIEQEYFDGMNLSIIEVAVEEQTVREVVEAERDNQNDTLEQVVASRNKQLEDYIQQIAADAYAYVHVDLTIQQNNETTDEETTILTVKDDTEWLIAA